MDRKRPRTNPKALPSNDRQQHAPDRSIHCCVDVIVLKQDRLWESENSLWENDYPIESLQRSGFDQSLTSAQILPEVFHLQTFLWSNKYSYGKMLFKNNKEAINKVNVHHRKNKVFSLFQILKGLDLAQVYQGRSLLRFALLVCTSASGLLRLEPRSAHLRVHTDCMPSGQKEEMLQRLEGELQMLKGLLINLQT